MIKKRIHKTRGEKNWDILTRFKEFMNKKKPEAQKKNTMEKVMMRYTPFDGKK